MVKKKIIASKCFKYQNKRRMNMHIQSVSLNNFTYGYDGRINILCVSMNKVPENFIYLHAVVLTDPFNSYYFLYILFIKKKMIFCILKFFISVDWKELITFSQPI